MPRLEKQIIFPFRKRFEESRPQEGTTTGLELVEESQAPIAMMDRRLNKRFDLNAPVTYSWKDQPGIRRSGHGTTRDVSECGLFVLTDSFPPVGTAIQFEVSFSFRDDSRVQMRARGMIVRVEANDGAQTAHGFAASTKALWMYHTAAKSAESLIPKLSAHGNRQTRDEV